MENKASEFFERYREIEEWVADHLNVREMKDLEKDPRFQNIRSNLIFCRKLRNLISHSDCSKGGQDLFVVTDAALKQVNALYYALNPHTLMRVAIPKSRIFGPGLSNSVLSTMKTMIRNDYSYVPIVEGANVIGVFSARVIMRYLSEHPSEAITEAMTFKDIQSYLSSIKDNECQYAFIAPDVTLEDAIRRFQGGRDKRMRPDVLFITEGGTADGKLQAMITPDDVVGF
ncbi:MAG: CBS domain-containing protein [Bacteroidales bacterium]|nr:CBS domain-containing protein [Bacteroidales bacterium]